MRLIRSILLSLSLVATMAGCNRFETPYGDGTVDSSFSLYTGGSPDTRALSATGESTVVRWCVFASQNGSIVGYATQSGNQKITMRLSEGESYDITAVVNYPTSFSPASYTAVSQVEDVVFDLSDNVPGRFIMFGQRNALVAGAYNTPIEVERLVAKVTLEGFSVDFSEDPSLADKVFTLNKIYLINVYGKNTLKERFDAPSASGSYWYNKRQNDDDLSYFLLDEDIDLVLSADDPYEETHTFYMYPHNVSEDSHEEEWCPRYTRIVVEAMLDYETRYFFMSFENIRRNRNYRIRGAVIKTGGSSSPDAQDSVGDITGEDITWEDLGEVDNDDISGEDIIWGDPEQW